MYPPSPGWIAKLFEGGRGSTIAAVVVAYWIGTQVGKSQRSPWHEIARQAGEHFREAGYAGHGREHNGKHTDREHDSHGHYTDREHERRQHRHGEGHDRGY